MKILLSTTIKEIELFLCCDRDLDFMKRLGKFEKQFNVPLFLLRGKKKIHH